MRTITVVYSLGIGISMCLPNFLSPALSQDACSAVLKQTNVSLVKTKDQKIALLQKIQSEEDWTNTKEAGGSLKVIYDGIPIGAEGNYKTFQSWRRSMLADTDYKFSDSQASATVANFLPKEAIEAWSKCVSRSGIFAFPENATDKQITVNLMWRPSNSSPVDLPAPTITGGHIQGALGLPARMTGPWSSSIIVQRDSNSDFRMTWSFGLDQANVYVPAIKPDHFTTSCVRDLTDFIGIAPIPGNPEGMSYFCTNMRPGATVDALISGTFQIDSGGGSWIGLQTRIDDRKPFINLESCTSGFDANHSCNGADSVTGVKLSGRPTEAVGPTGLVTLHVLVARAQDHSGNVKTLSATDGNITITTH